MTGKPLSHQKQAALFRAYKQRQTANYVATRCGISPHTAQKYIVSLNFKQRLDKLLTKANGLVDDDQAKSLAKDIITVSNLKTLIASELKTLLEKGNLQPGTSDYDRLVRLERYLRGEPESRTEQSVSFEWLDEEGPA